MKDVCLFSQLYVADVAQLVNKRVRFFSPLELQSLLPSVLRLCHIKVGHRKYRIDLCLLILRASQWLA